MHTCSSLSCSDDNILESRVIYHSATISTAQSISAVKLAPRRCHSPSPPGAACARHCSDKHDERRALLWTKGFVPRIQTALGLETPSPLDIRIDKGDADIDVVVRDILALTKLNYNACLYGDGLPVTLRFADKIGNILTATAEQTTCPPLSFKFYI